MYKWRETRLRKYMQSGWILQHAFGNNKFDMMELAQSETFTTEASCNGAGLHQVIATSPVVAASVKKCRAVYEWSYVRLEVRPERYVRFKCLRARTCKNGHRYQQPNALSKTLSEIPRAIISDNICIVNLWCRSQKSTWRLRFIKTLTRFKIKLDER